MPPYYFVILSLSEKLKQRNDYGIYEKILDGLIKMEVFCITCCLNQTNIICSNSNIVIKDYSLGYNEKLPDA
jgi:hypothetical protein